MRFHFCHAVFLSTLAVVIVLAAGDDDEGLILDVNIKGKAHILRHDGQKPDGNDKHKRSKRDFSSSEQKSILDSFNYQRRLVGASDMNYLTWDSGLEFYLWNWTTYCNYDTRFYTLTGEEYGIRLASGKLSAGSDIQALFADNEFYYGLRSVYAIKVAASYSYCPVARVQGRLYKEVYLFLYGLTTDSRFNETVQQYTPGPACTRCQNNVNWCYNNLCRGDCDSSTVDCCPINQNGQGPCVTAPPPRYGLASVAEAKKGIVILLGLLSVIYGRFQ